LDGGAWDNAGDCAPHRADDRHTVHLADLSLVGEARRVAREIAAAEPRIDVLVNNAGLISARRQVTAEG
jgi:NAD(P)-dependent dehydrogenase (short-subunit alcohol dehydrogenase family)